MLSVNTRNRDSAPGMLKSGIRNGKVYAGYIFAGPDGAGKFVSARNFAKALNCEKKKGDEPCGECAHCKRIDSSSHPDVSFLEPKGASSFIGIDEVREMIRKANLKPYEAKYKIFVIRDAHSMRAEAQNAFLKTLEEAPRDTIFVLTARAKELLLPTIASRCQVINFSPPASGAFFSAEVKDPLRDFGDYTDRNDLKKKIDLSVAYMRDMFLYKTLGDRAPLLMKERSGDIKKRAENVSIEELDGAIKKAIELRWYVSCNVNPKLAADVLANEMEKIK